MSNGRPILTRDEAIAEVDHLLGTDDGESIARRLGYASFDSLEKKLDRAGRKDLIRKLVHPELTRFSW